MLRTLLKRRAMPQATLPAGNRIYAIGDIHGRLDLLEDLLGQIDADDASRGPAATTLIFLGDLIDRGPHSAQVVERVRRIASERPATRCLLGNHEEVFLQALSGDERAVRAFCRIGGRETILSYGIDTAEYDRLTFEDMAARLPDLVPAAHREFLECCEDMVVLGDYAFVHAGIDPALPLQQQRTSDLRWIRSTFLRHAGPYEKTVVHGHTISEAPESRRNRIGIDTGAYSTGRLTALGLEDDARWFLQTDLALAETGEVSRRASGRSA